MTAITLALHAFADIKSEKREKIEALARGMRRHGDRLDIVNGYAGPVADGFLCLGISGHKRQLFDAYRAAGRAALLVDKGYCRSHSYLRFSLNASQPIGYLLHKSYPDDRFRKLGIELKPYRTAGACILFDGASRKFCAWNGFGNYTAWGAEIVGRIRRNADLPVVYRPRPTHHDDDVIDGTEFSRATLDDDLRRARVVVSYGGNIGFDAVVAGVPHFAIGDSIARPLSETQWQRVAQPRVPSEKDRLAWCAAVAYQQYTLSEIAGGDAWAMIREQLRNPSRWITGIAAVVVFGFALGVNETAALYWIDDLVAGLGEVVSEIFDDD